MNEKKNKKHSSKDDSSKNEFKEIYKKLQDSEEKWQSFVESTDDIIIIIDTKGIIRYINKVLPSYVVDEVVGTPIYEYLPQDQYKILEKHVNKVFETGKTENYKVLSDAPKTGNMWWHTKVFPIKHKDEVKDVLIVSADITSYRKVEEKLRESEGKYRELARLSPEIIFETDGKGNIVYVNEIAFKSFGYSRKEFDEGINAIQTLAPKDRDRARKNMEKTLRGEDAGPNEYTALRKDGSTFPVVVHSASIIYENKPVGMRGVMVNLSEIKRTEQKYRILFDSSPDLITEADEEGNFLAVNPAMAKSLGYSIDELIGKNVYDVLPKEIADKRLQIARKAMKENKIQE